MANDKKLVLSKNLDTLKKVYHLTNKNATRSLKVWGIYQWYQLKFKKHIIAHPRTIISGIRNINTSGTLEIGLMYVGFIHNYDRTHLNIRGKLNLASDYRIARGCRFDIEKNAVVSIGRGGYINSFTKIIIQHGLIIGDNCMISWDCQFLDEDFHHLEYSGRKVSDPKIILGNNVWVGCGTNLYKGSQIADGCVIAANSVVRGQFLQKNTLIAGNPAKVIKENIHWA